MCRQHMAASAVATGNDTSISEETIEEVADDSPATLGEEAFDESQAQASDVQSFINAVAYVSSYNEAAATKSVILTADIIFEQDTEIPLYGGLSFSETTSGHKIHTNGYTVSFISTERYYQLSQNGSDNDAVVLSLSCGEYDWSAYNGGCKPGEVVCALRGEKLSINVAQIGTTEYATLAAAIAAVPTDGTQTTITMIADVDYGDVCPTGTTEAVYVNDIASGKNVVLDLNGKTIKASRTGAKSVAIIHVTNGGKLTVNDTAGNGSIELYCGEETDPWAVSSSAIISNGEVVINGGLIKSTEKSGSYAIDVNQNGFTDETKPVSITINGGELSSTYVGLRLFANGGNLITGNVTGGTISGGKKGLWVHQSSSTGSTKKAVVNISGGYINSENGNAVEDWYQTTNGAEIEINITGGHFKANAEKAVVAMDTDAEKVAILAGYFNLEPAAKYIASGYEVASNTGSDEETYSYTVVKAKTFYADENGVYHIVNAAGLKEFRDQANAGNLNGQNDGINHTKIVLDADIDLKNEEWTPINGSCIDFDGQNHTIENLYVNTTGKNVGLFGTFSICKIENLTVDGANVTGINHVAALCGDGLCTHIIGCAVKNATVTTNVNKSDDGDKAGAICGYLSGESTAEVTNCTVDNCTVRGYRDIGGLVGYANVTASVTGNTITNTVIINDQEINYQKYTSDTQYDANKVIGEAHAEATVSNNTADNDVVVKIVNKKVDVDTNKKAAVTEQTQTSAVAVDETSDNATKNFATSETTTQNTIVTGVKLTDVPTVKVEKSDDITGLQAVVNAAVAKEKSSIKESIKTAETVSIEVKVNVKPTQYVAPAAETEGTVAFTLEPEATVTVGTGESATSETVTVTNEMINQAQNIEVKLYTGFEPSLIIHVADDGTKTSYTKADYASDSTFKYDKTLGTAIFYVHHFSDVWVYQQTKVASITNSSTTTYYNTLAAALLAAESGDTVEVLEGEWGADAIGTIDSSDVRYKSLTIKPATDAKVTFTSTLNLGYEDSSTSNATMNINGFAFKDASLYVCNYVQASVTNCTFDGSYNGGENNAALVIKNTCCTNHKSSGDYPTDQATVSGCTFSNTVSQAICMFNTGNATVTNNTITNAGHNGIGFQTNYSNSGTVTITGNTITEWNASNTSGGGRAIRLALGTLGEGSTVTVTGNTFRKTTLNLDDPDFAKITGTGSATVDLSGNDWNDELLSTVKGSSAYYTCDAATTTINSVVTTKKEKDPVASVNISGTTTNYTDLHDALEAGKASGSVVTLLSNVDLTGIDWAPIDTFQGTVDGAGYTISNLTVSRTTKAGLFENLSSGGLVKDLTITKANITATNNYAGAVAGYGFQSNVTGVIVTESVIKSTSGEYVGGIVGGTYTDITNCTVTGNTISGSEQVGGVIGYACGSEINGCTVSNTVSGSSRVGGVVGKFQSGDSSMTGINSNTVSGSVNATDDLDGGLAGQIMGKNTGYALKNNTINVTGTTNPIGTLRANQNETFTEVLAANITGNWWEDATLNADSFQYTNVAEGVDAQTIYRGVAKIGDTCYKTLQAAFDAATDNQTIQLIADITAPEDSGYTVAVGKAITLDLNNHTVTGTATNKGSCSLITNNGTLTVTDNSTEKGGKLTTSVNPGQYNAGYYVISNAGTLTIAGGTIEEATTDPGWSNNKLCYAIDVVAKSDNTPVLNITGGKVKCGYQALRVYCYGNAANTATVNISGGEVESYYGPLGIQISNGTTPNVKYNISGGTITSTNNSKLIYVDAHVANVDLTNVKYNLTGGFYNSTNAEIVNLDNTGGSYKEGTVNKDIIAISGGYYKVSPNTDYLASDKTITNTPEGDIKTAGYIYTVEDVPIAQIGETKYASLAEAIAAVPTDGTETTITMIGDETIPSNAGVSIASSKNVVLDLNGKTISNSVTESGSSAVITNYGTLKIKDSTDTNADGTGTGLLTNAVADETAGDYWSTPRKNYTSNVITNSGNLTIESGLIRNMAAGNICYCVDNQSNGTAYTPYLTINGGRLYNYYTSAIRAYCNSTTNMNTVEITGGIVEGFSAIWFQNPNTSNNKGTFIVSGGEIRTTDSDVVAGTIQLAESDSETYMNSKTTEFYAYITGGVFNDNFGFYGANSSNIHIENATDGTGPIFNGYISSTPEGYITGGYYKDSVITVPEGWEYAGWMWPDAMNEWVNEYSEFFGASTADEYIAKGEEYAKSKGYKFENKYNGYYYCIYQWTEEYSYHTFYNSEYFNSLINGDYKLVTTTSTDPYYGDDTYKIIAKTYVAQIGDNKYESLAEAIAAAQSGNEIDLLADFTDTGAISLPADVTLDGNNHKISGNSCVYINATGGTVKNVVFDTIHNSATTLTPIYGYNLSGNATVTGCTFSGWDWDAIQITPVAGASIDINGNTFNAASGTNVNRAVHVQSAKNVDFTCTVKGNKFTGCSNLKNTGIEVYYPAVASKLDCSGNYMDSPMAVCIGTGTSYNNATEKALPFKDVNLENEVSVVASIADANGNDRLYTYLADAVNAATTGQTIKLLADINLTAQQEIAGKEITIDLNGKTITYTGTTTLASGVLLVHNGAGLTVTDSTTNQAGAIYGGTKAYAAIALTKSGDNAANEAKLTVNAGTLTGNYYAIVGNGNRHNTAITISGGKLTCLDSSGTGIYNPQNGTLSITGGMIEAPNGVYVKSGTVTAVTGGTIKATGAKGEYKYNGSGFDSTGDAIVVDNCNYPGGSPSVTINGATLISANGFQIGAYYSSPETGISVIYSTDNTLTAPDGYVWTATETAGTYKLAKAVAKIGDTKYATLADAIAAVQNNETITMLCDVKNASGISINTGKTFTIDFANHTYSFCKPGAGSTGTQTQGFQILKGQTVTLKNGTLNCMESNKDATEETNCKPIKMLVNNYCDLTLDNMTLDGTNLNGTGRYTLSVNNGTVTINNSTITAQAGGFAFDSYYVGSTAYTAPDVNVTGTSVINGKVEATGGDINFKTGTTLNGMLRVGENKNGTKVKDSVVTIESGATIDNAANGYAIAVFGNNTLNIEGTVKGSIATNGNSYNAGSVINIKEGAEITQSTAADYDTAVYMPNGELNISGGTITGNTAVYFKSTKIDITGGTLIGNGPQADYVYDGSGCSATGDALVIDSCNYPSGIESIAISGGVFKSTNGVSVAAFTSQGGTAQTGFITGGYFSDMPDSTYVADGMYVPADKVTVGSDQLYTVLKAVAQIGDTKYSSLADAVTAAQTGDTITILSNIDLTAQQEIAGKEITIDLNGKTIKYTGTTLLTSGVLLVHNGAGLTVTDSSSAADGKIDANGTGDANGDIASGAYAAIALTKSGDDATNAAKLTVSKGTLEGFYYAVVGNGSRPNTVITINGGTLKGTNTVSSQGIFHPQNGTLTITGGTISGHDTAVEMRAGTINVSGGKLTATATEYSCTSNGSGSTTVGAALAIAQHTTKKDIKVTITGGTFTGVKAISESNPQANDPKPQVTMSVIDGQFSGEITIADAPTAGFISGGVFSVKPDAAYLATGYSVINNSDSGTRVAYPYAIGNTTSGIVIRAEDGTNPEVAVSVDTTVKYSVNVETLKGVDIPDEVLEEIKNKTVVEGVELEPNATTALGNINGVQAVVNAAKTKAETDKNTAFTNAVEESSNVDTTVTVKVDVKVTPVGYASTDTTGVANNTIKFDLTPYATVSIRNGDAATVSQTVEVTNDMIDQDQDIEVTLYTGFNPIKLIHKSDDGATIDEFYPTGTAEKTKFFTYDEATGSCKVTIHHFSTIEGVAKAGETVVATIGETGYTSLQYAVNAVQDGQTILIYKANTEAITVKEAKTYYIAAGDGYEGEFKLESIITPAAAEHYKISLVQHDQQTETVKVVCGEITHTVSLTSRIAGTETTVAPLGGGGNIGEVTGTTLYASNKDGYTFEGWFTSYDKSITDYSKDSSGKYVNETLKSALVSSEAVFDYTPDTTDPAGEEISLYAVYQVNAGAMVELTINASTFTLNDEEQYSEYEDYLTSGTSITLEYTGTDKFLYWRNGSYAVVSINEEFTTTLVSDTEFTAVTADDQTTGRALVVFKNVYGDDTGKGGQQIKSNYYTDKSNITFPSNPTSYGKTFKNWAVKDSNGKEWEATVDKIHELIAGGATYLIVYGKFDYITSYKVTINGKANNADQGYLSSVTVGSGDLASIWASDMATLDNKSYFFSHWELNGENVSSNLCYHFAPEGNVTIYAVYDQSPTHSSIDRVKMDTVTATTDGNKYKITLKATYSIGQNDDDRVEINVDDITKYGILYWTDPRVKFIYENKDYIKYYEWDHTSTDPASGTMILHVTTSQPDTIIYYRAYVIKKDGTVVYSPEIESTSTWTYSGSSSYNSADKY